MGLHRVDQRYWKFVWWGWCARFGVAWASWRGGAYAWRMRRGNKSYISAYCRAACCRASPATAATTSTSCETGEGDGGPSLPRGWAGRGMACRWQGWSRCDVVTTPRIPRSRHGCAASAVFVVAVVSGQLRGGVRDRSKAPEEGLVWRDIQEQHQCVRELVGEALLGQMLMDAVSGGNVPYWRVSKPC